MGNKEKYSFWMTPEMIDEIDKTLPYSYDSNRSSFVRSAVNVYIGYLMQKRSVDYLAPMISNEIKNQVESLQDCLSEMIFKLAVESAKQNFILSCAYKIDDELYNNDLAKEFYG